MMATGTHYPRSAHPSARIPFSRGRYEECRRTSKSLPTAFQFTKVLFIIVAVSVSIDPPRSLLSSWVVSAFVIVPHKAKQPAATLHSDRVRRRNLSSPVPFHWICRGGPLNAAKGGDAEVVVEDAARAETTSPTSATGTKRDAPPTSAYFGTTDEDFETWFSSLLSDSPLRSRYPHVFDAAIRAVVSWRRRYRGNPALWRRIFKAERVSKELIEAVPIIDATMKLVEDYEPDDAEADAEGGGRGKLTIVDLASGKGYLSMFLSEMLPPEKVEKFILVDKAWPMCNAEEILPHQMNWEHLYGNVTEYVLDEAAGDDREADDTAAAAKRFVRTGETYFTTWPIHLHTSKQDLKQKCNTRQMKKRIFAVAPGPIVVLAVHLCGALSLRAVDMFNNYDNVSFLALKPCCLPPMAYANRGEVFSLGRHSFDAKEVCSNGKFRGNRWYGPPRWHLEGKFNSWADHLYRGMDIGGAGMDGSTALEANADGAAEEMGYAGRKRKFDVDVQVEGGFQNTYVFAQRRPVTESLWEEHIGGATEAKVTRK